VKEERKIGHTGIAISGEEGGKRKEVIN